MDALNFSTLSMIFPLQEVERVDGCAACISVSRRRFIPTALAEAMRRAKRQVIGDASAELRFARHARVPTASTLTARRVPKGRGAFWENG